MTSSGIDLSSYLKVVSPPRSSLHEILFNSPQPERIENDSVFCERNNVQECSEYLSAECEMLGLPSLLNHQGVLDVTKLLNLTHRLLRKYQQSSRSREELENRVHRCNSDLNYSQNTQKQLQAANDSLLTDVARHENKQRQLQLECTNLRSKLRTHANEVKRLKSLLSSNEIQFRHELKKKERQLNQIKERAHQLLADKNKPVHAATFDISRCLHRHDGRRATWKHGASNQRHEEHLMNTVVGNFEKRCAALQSENCQLREMLSDVWKELSLVTQSDNRLSNDELQLPIDLISNRLMETLRSHCQVVSDLRLKKSSGLGQLNSTFTLGEELASEEEAEENNETPSDNSTNETSILEEQNKLAKQKHALYKQQAELEQQKMTVTEAVLQLSREKKKFEDYKKRVDLSDGTSAKDSLKVPSPSKSPRPSSRSQNSPGRISVDEHKEFVKMAVISKKEPHDQP